MSSSSQRRCGISCGVYGECGGGSHQERLNDEGLVAWNGDSPVDHIFPIGEDVVHFDSLVSEALTLYSSQYKKEGFQEGYFIRKSENIKDSIISEVLDSIVKKPV